VIYNIKFTANFRRRRKPATEEHLIFSIWLATMWKPILGRDKSCQVIFLAASWKSLYTLLILTTNYWGRFGRRKRSDWGRTSPQ